MSVGVTTDQKKQIYLPRTHSYLEFVTFTQFG